MAEELEALRKAAWAAQLEFERKQEAKRHAAREEEARRKKEEAALRKKLLEAAYDGEDEEVCGDEAGCTGEGRVGRALH